MELKISHSNAQVVQKHSNQQQNWNIILQDSTNFETSSHVRIAENFIQGKKELQN